MPGWVFIIAITNPMTCTMQCIDVQSIDVRVHSVLLCNTSINVAAFKIVRTSQPHAIFSHID